MSGTTFGAYGGRYVPETLIPALDELDARHGRRCARRRRLPRRARRAARRRYAGRPTPLTRAARFAPDKRVYLKREDLLHTGAHKLNNALGQAVVARRLGKQRIVAETGAGQHGVATATVCARFGLECIVYMGSEDMRRQAPNVERMRLLGAEVRPVEFGTRTLKEATSEAIRDWIANVETTYYLIGSCVGPAPYPELVRELQRVIGREAREQLLAAEGRLPGGRGRLRRRRLERDRHLLRLRRRRRRAADRRRGGRRGVARRRGAPASCTERARRCSPTRTGRSSTRIRSRPGSTIPGVGPEHALSARHGPGASTSPPRTTRRSPRSTGSAGPRGSSPRSSRRTHSRARSSSTPSSSLVCLSGRGDKDLAEVLRRMRSR